MITISEAESEVIAVLWKRSPLSAEEVVAAVQRHKDWHEKTIKTLLSRLLRKGALTHSKDGRRYLYSPRLRREEYVHQRSRDLLDRLFGGRLAPLLAHFSERERISARDLEEIKRIIARLDRE